MKSRSGLNAYQAAKPAMIRTNRATFNLFDTFEFSSSNFATNCWSRLRIDPYKPIFKRRQPGRRCLFQQSFQWRVISSFSGSQAAACICETTQLQANVSACCDRDEAAPRDYSE